jgi:hypothetical protein
MLLLEIEVKFNPGDKVRLINSILDGLDGEVCAPGYIGPYQHLPLYQVDLTKHNWGVRVLREDQLESIDETIN